MPADELNPYSQIGDCYEAAGKWFIRNSHMRLVHGEVTGQGPLEGVKFGHAWVEDGGTVIDTSMGRHVEMPKAVYYALGRIGDNVIYYDWPRFSKLINKFKHWGPWELKTSTEL